MMSNRAGLCVVCVDPSVTGGKLAKGAVYEVSDVISDQHGDYFRLVETGPACWFVDRFRPFDNSQFLSGADEASSIWDNRKQKETAQ